VNTTLEPNAAKRIPPAGGNDKQDRRSDDEKEYSGRTRRAEAWARVSATVGAVVWAAMAVMARMGIARIGEIELLFLFAPLVVVPLGMELGRALRATGRLGEIGLKLQPAGAALAVVAIWLPVGRKAAIMALGWLAVCLVIAVSGAVEFVRALWRDGPRGARTTRIVVGIGQMDLAVGGPWLVASRLGMRPMGIQEPIGLLTAVHFHFAGFATAMIAAATLRFVERRGERGGQRWLKAIVLMAAVMPIVVAAGFVISPALKMTAALAFSASVAGLAVFVRACGTRAEDRTAGVLLQVAAGAIFAGMVLAGTYAVADFVGSERLTIPEMARTHGILNAMGFCLPGMLGWLIERSGR